MIYTPDNTHNTHNSHNAHNTNPHPVLLNTLTVLRLAAAGVLSDRATDASAPVARPVSAGTGNGFSAAVGGTRDQIQKQIR